MSVFLVQPLQGLESYDISLTKKHTAIDVKYLLYLMQHYKF